MTGVKGKLAVATGVTLGGAGCDMAEQLALSAEMDVIIMGRNGGKLKNSIEAIEGEAKNRGLPDPTLCEVKHDLNSPESANSAAKGAIKIAGEKCDGKSHVPMNNAGPCCAECGLTKEGVETNTGCDFLYTCVDGEAPSTPSQGSNGHSR